MCLTSDLKFFSVLLCRLQTTVRTHRNTAFAIVNESVINSTPAVQAIAPPETVPTSSVEALPSVPPPNPGRVSPFRGKGFKPDLNSRHTTPKTSTTTSPQRSRTNSITKPTVSFERPPTPPRNYIKENIQEIKELSQFNKERNEELAAQKKFEEELEILKELGVISDAKLISIGHPGVKRVDSRSKMISPSILHFENIPIGSRPQYEDAFDSFSWKPPTGKTSMRAVSRSQPQSKSGSPQHHSKIPRRQASVSPPRQKISFEDQSPSRMSNRISADGRFISNSTSSINDKRVFSVVTDDALNPELSSQSRSKSSQNLEAPTSILKSKPPKSPNKLGPPPTSKTINSKRLSPIVATPDKSPAKDGSVKGNVGKSKTPTPRVTSPSKIPKRPSKSLATTPNGSRAPSRAPSRGTLADSATLKKANAAAKASNQAGKTTSGRNSRSETRPDSKDGKPTLKRINSRTSISSKMSFAGKPELTRTNSRTSLAKSLTRTNSIKSINEKSGTLKRKTSMKNLKETSIEENASKEKSPKSKSARSNKSDKSEKKEGKRKDEIPTQDSETQWDKLSQIDMSLDKLIPLTKGNVVSMTTAAITSQPLEIAAKVTSQLPAAFEKARDRGILGRNSSSDSIAVKTMVEATKADGAETTTKNEKTDKDKKDLQKTASKTSLGSVKEEKEPVKKGGVKLVPLSDIKLDPQMEKVKMKIENILKSNQSSVVDLKERVEREEKLAAEKMSKALEKAAENVENDVKKVTETAIIEKPPDKMISVDPPTSKLKKDGKKDDEKKKNSEDARQVPPKETNGHSGSNGVATMNVSKKNGVDMSGITPVESVPTKVDVAKTNLDSSKSPHAEMVIVKESVVKKDTIIPNVKLVNEKGLGNPVVDGSERVTESIVRGEPDVEVQSGNISPAVMAAASANVKPTTSKTLRNGTSFGSSNGSSNGNGTTNGAK